MEVVVSGAAMSFRQASHAASMMASTFSKTRLESQFWRRYCQIFSTGFSSGAREGRKIGVMFSGTSSLPVVCHPARSSTRTACAPSVVDRIGLEFAFGGGFTFDLRQPGGVAGTGEE